MRILGLRIGLVVLALVAVACSTDESTPSFHWGVAMDGPQNEPAAPGSNWDAYQYQTSPPSEPFGLSADFRHKYPEDIELARSLGIDVFRLSIQWTRIEPEEGVTDEGELAYYDDLLSRLESAGMTPMITLTHFDYPQWIGDQGAWVNPETVDKWLDYARLIVSRYAGRGYWWITFNEPEQFRVSHELRRRPLTVPGLAAMKDNLVSAHRRAYDMIHEVDSSTAGVTATEYWLGEPGTSLLNDGTLHDPLVIDQLRDKLDFIGLDYYFDFRGPNDISNWIGERLADVEWDPEGLYRAIKWYRERYPELPVYVTENGFITEDDLPHPDGYQRCLHLADHVAQVQRAIAEGEPLLGYNYWTLTDNWEWGSFTHRYGLWSIPGIRDGDLRRVPTDAIGTFQQITREGGVPDDYQLVKTGEGYQQDRVEDGCLAP